MGQYVVNQIIDNLKLRGYVSLGPYTDQSNEQAQSCYSKCGFDIWILKQNEILPIR
ncbi:MAG: hypothetical protein LBS21_06035 [Clostridiales bacterium]|nr:hypothetical protein [Clostridiales bacterium]